MSEGDGSRRGALKHLVLLGGAAFACAVAAPAAVFVSAPARASGSGGAGGRWVRIVRLESLREGAPKKVAIVADDRDAWTLSRDVNLGAVWLVRKGEAVTAFSAVCPHLGCSVDARAESGFVCPCHDSAFGPDGACTSGPSPRGLDTLETRVEGGFVEVDFKRFRIGVADREAIG